MRLDEAYGSNKTIATKINFARDRGYVMQAMRYGIAVSNNNFDTIFVAIVPRHEGNPKTSPIFVIPAGQRVNIPKNDIDFDDELVFLAIVNTTTLMR